jgi:dihydrofolate reductase
MFHFREKASGCCPQRQACGRNPIFPFLLQGENIFMNLIAAVDRNWAIGNKGQLLVRIPNDHKMFRKETLDKVVVYGRKTLETFPLSQPLDRRVNIILSKNPNLQVRHARVVHSVEELLEACREYPSEDVYVIGGASVYKQLLPYCDTAHITKVDYAYEADAWFPNLDEDPDWEITADSDEQTYFDIPYQFVKYERKK